MVGKNTKLNVIQTTFSGRLLASAIFVIGKALVFEANIQCSGTTDSISLITLCLIARSSKTKKNNIKKNNILDSQQTVAKKINIYQPL